MQELKLLTIIHQLVSVDKPSGNRTRVQNEVFGHAHQDMPVIARVGKAAHGHTADKHRNNWVRALGFGKGGEKAQEGGGPQFPVS